MNTRTAPVRATGGPHPGAVGLVSLVLLVGSLVAMAALSGGGTITSPFGDTSTVAGFFAEHGFAVRLAAMLQLGSSIPLGIYTATVYARQQRLGIRVPGPAIGLFGGVAAAVLLAVSATITWAQGQPVVSAQTEFTHALSYLSFATGGFAHVLGLGLLVAGQSRWQQKRARQQSHDLHQLFHSNHATLAPKPRGPAALQRLWSLSPATQSTSTSSSHRRRRRRRLDGRIGSELHWPRMQPLSNPSYFCMAAQ